MNIKKIGTAMVMMALLFSLHGCWVTAKQGQAMTKKIIALDEKVSEMDKKVNTNYHQILMQAQEDINNLKEIIERATKNLGENTADFALMIDKLKVDLNAMEGTLAELSYKLDTLTKEVEEDKKKQAAAMEKYQKFMGIDKPIEPSKIPSDKDKHWEKAASALKDKDYELARGLFREFQKKYPDDPKSDDAQLNIGIAYLEEKSGAKTLGELQKVIDKYPNSDKMDAVLYYMGEAFFLIQNCADARTLFKTVIVQFPKSPYKKKSVKRIQDILKAPKSVCPTIK